MRKFIVSILVGFVVFEGIYALATTTQYHNVGAIAVSSATYAGGLGLWSQTVAQIKALTSTTTGQVLFCSDCGAAGGKGTICVSTGTVNPYAWVLSTGTVCQ